MYNCMFVSALPDPTCNSEKSANGGNKQILLLLLLLLLLLFPFSVALALRKANFVVDKSNISNKSALCSIASFVFIFVLMPKLC